MPKVTDVDLNINALTEQVDQHPIFEHMTVKARFRVSSQSEKFCFLNQNNKTLKSIILS